jgi:uncharacterized protein
MNGKLCAWLAPLLMTLIAGAAGAASFDCGQARKPVERMICADKVVSGLDERLDATYRAAKDAALDPVMLARTQRMWLTQRDLCRDAACLAGAYRERIAAIGRMPLAGWLTYDNPRLGIAFDYLANRRVVPCGAGRGPRCVMLVSRNMGISDYLIEFKLVDGPLETVAKSEAGFEPQNGRWMTTYGRFEPVPVERFSGRGWTGMRATITCGIGDANGFHAGAGDCFWAVMSDGKRSVVADTEGMLGDDAATKRSVSSFRFTR